MIAIAGKQGKAKGSVILVTVLAAILWIFIAQSMFITGAGSMGLLKSSRVALQAQQYAQIEADRLKNVDYYELDANGPHSRQRIQGIDATDWESEVTIGAEHDIAGGDGAKQRIATVNVYKTGDSLSRFTLEVPLSSLA